MTEVSARSVDKKGPELEQDKLSLEDANKLNAALAESPASRPEQVAQAKRLVLDTSYPPEVLIHKISALLANNMGTA